MSETNEVKPKKPLRIPDPKDFDPKADASDWPIEDMTKPLPDWKDFDPATAPADPSLGRDVTKEVVANRGGVQIIGGVRPPPKPSAVESVRLKERGRELLDRCEYAEALKCFERQLEILQALGLRWQEMADALTHKAEVLSRLRRHDEAVSAFDEAIVLEQELREQTELDVEGAKTVMNKGLALTNAGRADEGAACYQTALAVFRRAYEAGSDSAGRMVALTLFNIGEAHRCSNRFGEAIASYDQSLEIHHRLTADGKPSAAEATVWKGKSHALLRSEQFEAALDVAQRAIDILEPLAAEGRASLQFELSWAFHWKGRALERLHRPFMASECHRRASELVDAFKPTADSRH